MPLALALASALASASYTFRVFVVNKTSLPSADPKVSMCSTAEITGLSFSCSLIPRDLAMVTHNLKYMDQNQNQNQIKSNQNKTKQNK